jgi:uncharacterized protein (DUF2237 family)
MTEVLRFAAPKLEADPDARRVSKVEVVLVEFATAAGALQSAVGLNRYAAGDALLTGSTGDRWCVSRDRFDAKYRPEPPTVAGAPGRYRNLPVTILAKQIPLPFTVHRSAGGDLLHGKPGDWLVQYAPGDHGVVAGDRFARVYRFL